MTISKYFRGLRALAVGITLLMLITPRGVGAHVLVQDLSGTTGAVLHVGLDDDPRAGELSGVYYSLKTDMDLSKTSIKLTATNQRSNVQAEIPVAAGEGTVHGAYTFPTDGLYELNLTISPTTISPVFNALTFTSSVQASGEAGSMAYSAPPWAVSGLIAVGWVYALLGVITFRRRRAIIANSR